MSADMQPIMTMDLCSDVIIADEAGGRCEQPNWHFKPGGPVYEATRRKGLNNALKQHLTQKAGGEHAHPPQLYCFAHIVDTPGGCRGTLWDDPSLITALRLQGPQPLHARFMCSACPCSWK